jgi:4-amino-4-deoxy-L-arabinose transferase-like glycosyltransferase
MNRQLAKMLLVVLFILWIFFVLGSFFVVQKPFSPANVVAVGRSLLDLLMVGWITFIALGIGNWLLGRLLPKNTLTLGETIVLGTGLGLGIIGLLSFGLGLAGLFQPGVVYGVTVALTVFTAFQLKNLRPLPRKWQVDSPGGLPLTYLLLITLFTMLVALLPPTDWDGLFYHLTGPKIYIQAGGIIGGIDIPHLSFPSLMEMLYTWAMLLRGDVAAKLLHPVFGFLLAGLVYLSASRFFNQKSSWLALLIFASMPMVGTLAGWAYNDLALAFYQLGSLYVLIRWALAVKVTDFPPPPLSPLASRFSPFSWLVLSGIFAGLAIGLKYTSFVTPLIIVSFLLWYSFRDSTHHALRTTLFSLAAFVLPALLIALPWYIKNWLFTGNPVYPFLYSVFGGFYWDAFRADWYAAGGTGIGWQPGTLLMLPWLLTLGFKDVNYIDGRTGPLLLLFLPLIIWAGLTRKNERPPALSLLLIYALTHFAFWTVGVMWSRSLWQSRLLLSGLVALVPVAGWLWAGLSNYKISTFSLGRFVNIAVGLTLALVVIDIGLFTLRTDPLPYLVGLETRDANLTRRLGGHYAAMQQINAELPPHAVVIFLWEPRSYYCQRDCRPDSILDTFPHLVHQYGSAAAIAKAWRQTGVTHVLIHRAGLSFVLSESPEVVDTRILADLERNFLTPAFDAVGGYQLFKLVQE